MLRPSVIPTRFMVGAELQSLMRKRGWSFEALAEEMERSAATLFRWCSDQEAIEVGTAVELALVLNVPVSAFLARP
jgi:transcriptional regulator with XRE-family HTH domain